jgi:hypothetical protein
MYDDEDLIDFYNHISMRQRGRQMVRHQWMTLVLVGSIPTPKFFDEYILKNFEGGFAHR